MGSHWRLLPQLESNSHSAQHSGKRHGACDVGPFAVNGGYRPDGSITRRLYRKALAFTARNGFYYWSTHARTSSCHYGYATRLPFNVVDQLQLFNGK